MATIEKGTLLRRTIMDGKGKQTTQEYRYHGTGQKDKNGNVISHYLRSELTGEVVKEPVKTAELEKMTAVPGTGMSEYLASFVEAITANTSSAWTIGDLAAKKDVYGLTFAELADKVGIGEASLSTYAGVARSYPAAERVEGVSFAHHQACQGNKGRADILKRALVEKLPVSAVKALARETKTSTAGRKAKTPVASSPALTPAPSANAVPASTPAPLAGGTLDTWTPGQRVVLSAELSKKLHAFAGGGMAAALAVAEKAITEWLDVRNKPTQPVKTVKPVETVNIPADKARSGRFGKLEMTDAVSAA
jgi:hypothetical protein